VARAVAAANSAVSRAESIRVFKVLPEPFDVTGGLLTPSMKPRRDAIVRHYAPDIDAMYAARAPLPRLGVTTEPAGWEDSDDVFR
jgi:long-chain acyl-CoA synthetase